MRAKNKISMISIMKPKVKGVSKKFVDCYPHGELLRHCKEKDLKKIFKGK